MEKCKWQKELDVFDSLVNTIVLTGNIIDQQPSVNPENGELKNLCTIEEYIALNCARKGFRAILLYNPVDGLHTFHNLKQGCDPVKLAKKCADEEGIKYTEEDTPEEGTSLFTDGNEQAAHIISAVLKQKAVPVSVIVSFSSRLAARPDDLDTEERMTFMYLQQGAVHAGTVPAEKGKNTVIRNKLYLIADKLNDLPAWFYLSHPSLKNIDIPRPDFALREQIISEYSHRFPGYEKSDDAAKKLFLEKFSGAAEGFTLNDIRQVCIIARSGGYDINSIDKAILLYKHGVQDNPWLKLDKERLSNAKESIKKSVIGQDAAVTAAIDIIKRARMGMSGLQHSTSNVKPRGILFLAGPTGTGKTELAKALTELVFYDERNMIRFDMSEYYQSNSDQRLLGAPPGYVGYEAGGQLTNAVRERPFSVLLFDEIEKADASVLDKFLQILDDGRITDGRGETVYFQNCLIIFTSNLGMTVPSPDNPNVRVENVSYEKDTDYSSVREKIIKGVRNYFIYEKGKPELLNRIGNNILVFDFIREDSLPAIISKQTKKIAENLLNERNIILNILPSAEEDLFLLAKADLPQGQGGRGVGNMIEEALINPLAGFMFDNGAFGDRTINIKHIRRENGLAELEAELV